MSYGHAERTLVAIRLLEAETRDLLGSLGRLSPEQAQWLDDVAETASPRLHSAGVALLIHDEPAWRGSPAP